MTTFLYAFNPQLKSCKFFIPENLRAVALNNFVGIVLDNGSYLSFPAGYQIVPVFGDHPVKFGYLIRAVLQIGVHGNDHVTFSPLESAMQSRRLTVVATELDSRTCGERCFNSSITSQELSVLPSFTKMTS